MVAMPPTIALPEPGEVRYPNDPVGRGHYVKVVAADDDWVEVECFYDYLGDTPHVRRIRLSTYLSRYSP